MAEEEKRYRKLRLELNTKTPKESRILDVESGDEILVEDAQIVCGRATMYGIEVLLTLKAPESIEVVTKEE